MSAPDTPGGGFTFRKKTFRTPRNNKVAKSMTTGNDQENQDGLITRTEMARRTKRVLTAEEPVAPVDADLVELEFTHKKSKASPRTISRRLSTDGCAHSRTPTVGEVRQQARAEGHQNNESIEAFVNAAEEEVLAKRRVNEAADAQRLAEQRRVEDIARAERRRRETLAAEAAAYSAAEASIAGDSFEGVDFVPEAGAFERAERDQMAASSQPKQQSKKRKADSGTKSKRALKLARTMSVSADTRITGEELADKLKPVISAAMRTISTDNAQRHPAVVSCMQDICADFERHVASEKSFKRSNIIPNARNTELRDKERSLRVLCGRLDAELAVWTRYRAELRKQQSAEIDEETRSDERANASVADKAKMPEIEAFDPNPTLQNWVLSIDEMVPVLQAMQQQESEARTFCSQVSRAIAHEDFAVYGQQEDTRDLISQLTQF